jgi:hypothetical protein
VKAFRDETRAAVKARRQWLCDLRRQLSERRRMRVEVKLKVKLKMMVRKLTMERGRRAAGASVADVRARAAGVPHKGRKLYLLAPACANVGAE